MRCLKCKTVILIFLIFIGKTTYNYGEFSFKDSEKYLLLSPLIPFNFNFGFIPYKSVKTSGYWSYELEYGVKLRDKLYLKFTMNNWLSRNNPPGKNEEEPTYSISSYNWLIGLNYKLFNDLNIFGGISTGVYLQDIIVPEVYKSIGTFFRKEKLQPGLTLELLSLGIGRIKCLEGLYIKFAFSIIFFNIKTPYYTKHYNLYLFSFTFGFNKTIKKGDKTL